MFRNLSRNSNLESSIERKGALTVEFALTLPLVFMLLFGAIEFLYVNMVRCSAESAAYEGARRGVVPGATAAQAEAAAQEILDAVGTRNERITVTPSSITPTTDSVTVTVEVPLDSNSLISPRYMRGKTLRKSCTLQRERLDTSVVP